MGEKELFFNSQNNGWNNKKKGKFLLTKSIVHIHTNNLLIEDNGAHTQEPLLEKQLFQNMEQGYQLRPR